MRTIKFRGKRLTDGKWIYGDFIRDRGLVFIADDTVEKPTRGDWNVDPTTVSRFTGKIDWNGKEVYEGDIIEYRSPNSDFDDSWHRGKVYWNDLWWGFCVDGCDDFDAEKMEYRVIGNSYDNPELLEGGNA